MLITGRINVHKVKIKETEATGKFPSVFQSGSRVECCMPSDLGDFSGVAPFIYGKGFHWTFAQGFNIFQKTGGGQDMRRAWIKMGTKIKLILKLIFFFIVVLPGASRGRNNPNINRQKKQNVKEEHFSRLLRIWTRVTIFWFPKKKKRGHLAKSFRFEHIQPQIMLLLAQEWLLNYSSELEYLPVTQKVHFLNHTQKINKYRN